MALIRSIGMLLLAAAGFFLNIYVIRNRWLHVLMILVGFLALYLGYHYLQGHARWMRLAFYLIWGGEMIIFGVYTVMTLMFSYPPR